MDINQKIAKLTPYQDKEFIQFNHNEFSLSVHVWLFVHKSIGDDLKLWPHKYHPMTEVNACTIKRPDDYLEIRFKIAPALDANGDAVPVELEFLLDRAIELVEDFEEAEQKRIEKMKNEMKPLPQEG